MMVDIDRIYKIIADVDCDDIEDRSEEWQKGYDQAVARIRYKVLQIGEEES